LKILDFTTALHRRDSRAPPAGPAGLFVAGAKTRVYIETEHSIGCALAHRRRRAKSLRPNKTC
jgi:hypothetical protein